MARRALAPELGYLNEFSPLGLDLLLLSFQAVLDYASLELQPFYAGAAVRLGQQFHRVADPLRCAWRIPSLLHEARTHAWIRAFCALTSGAS